MALLTTNSLLRLHNSTTPARLPLPKSFFQCHLNSTAFTTFVTSPKFLSPISNTRTHPLSSVPSATLNQDEWGTNPKKPSNLNDDEWGTDPKPVTENPQNSSPNTENPQNSIPNMENPQNSISNMENPQNSNPNMATESEVKDPPEAKFVDEWGERADPDEFSSQTRLPDADPPSVEEEDEWGDASDKPSTESDTSSPADGGLKELKQSLVDSFYGTEYGLRASSEARAEIGELISQLEALNPTPSPTEATSLLQGNWVLVYTSFSELLPLIAAGTLPFFRLGKICQAINTDNFTVENSASYIGPFATFSVRALASFELRSPKRIQVKFEEGIIPPPEITTTLDIPQNIEIFGQKINLSSFQGSLIPLQEAATRISQVISGQPPIKIPIRRDGSQSWLLITYLDEDLRISRGDGGGLFVLVKEGSPLLNL